MPRGTVTSPRRRTVAARSSPALCTADHRALQETVTLVPTLGGDYHYRRERIAGDRKPCPVCPIRDSRSHSAASRTNVSGLRIGELGDLRWRAIDLARGKLTIEHSKTEAGEWRKIDMTPMLLEELKLHLASVGSPKPDDLVFPTSKGRARNKDNSRGRLLTILGRANKARAKKGLPPVAHVTNHTLRRTFASLLYEAGETPPYVMNQMGHKSAAMALEMYARRMKSQRETGAKVDALVGDWAQAGTNGVDAAEALTALATEDAD
jgi:integrase